MLAVLVLENRSFGDRNCKWPVQASKARDRFHSPIWELDFVGSVSVAVHVSRVRYER